jgi:23S rRNA (uridine2552-2'-O)-methyltransferase
MAPHEKQGSGVRSEERALKKPFPQGISLKTYWNADRYRPMKRDRWEDHYARRAREERWLARSVYKLQEMDRKFKLIRKGDHLLDLGCYPGSWSQYGSRQVGPRGRVVGVDLTEPDRFSADNFRFIRADVLDLDPGWLATEAGPMDVVMSDLAPRTSGIRAADAARSMALAEKALEIALTLLKEGGRFLVKVFESEDLTAFAARLAAHFGSTRRLRPEAVRKASREVYVIGLERRGHSQG